MKLTQRMTKATTRGLIAVAGLALLLGAQSAMATPIPITSFSYTSNIGFVSWTPASVTASNPYGATVPNGTTTPSGTPESKLTWGTASNPEGNTSSLDLTQPNVTGTLTVGDTTPQLDAILTHDNYVITGDSLLTADILGEFTLTVTNPPPPMGGETLGPVGTTFNILFQETPNSGTCAAPPQSNPCSDIFVLKNADTIHANFDGALFGSQFAGYTYHLTLGTINDSGAFEQLPTLTNAECAAVSGAGPNCRGFYTQENQSTTKKFGIIITSSLNEVPEPMPIALFGLGLLALGVMLRRRRRTDHSND